ncbi:MAG: hypothetical protein ABWY00_04295 [Dongiaceae bacterium]
MTDNDRKAVTATKQMAVALARWEGEGGGRLAQLPQQHMDALAAPERQVLERLGAALVTKWNDLPTNVQRAIFQHASAIEESYDPIQLKTRIARFLHDHKDDTSES